MRTKRLSANQLDVLRMACTHGHVTQGCVQQCDYGARSRVLTSLVRHGLLTIMVEPTDKGRQVLANDGKLS